jgi:hypothetical protein
MDLLDASAQRPWSREQRAAEPLTKRRLGPEYENFLIPFWHFRLFSFSSSVDSPGISLQP